TRPRGCGRGPTRPVRRPPPPASSPPATPRRYGGRPRRARGRAPPLSAPPPPPSLPPPPRPPPRAAACAFPKSRRPPRPAVLVGAVVVRPGQEVVGLGRLLRRLRRLDSLLHLFAGQLERLLGPGLVGLGGDQRLFRHRDLQGDFLAETGEARLLPTQFRLGR